MGEKGDMMDAFQKIERSVREASAREHIAQYNALQMQMEAERQQDNAKRANLIAAAIGIFALLAMVIVVIVIIKDRTIKRKNRILAQQITDMVKYKKIGQVKMAMETDLLVLSGPILMKPTIAAFARQDGMCRLLRSGMNWRAMSVRIMHVTTTPLMLQRH